VAYIIKILENNNGPFETLLVPLRTLENYSLCNIWI